jgi:hypothetical protein
MMSGVALPHPQLLPVPVMPPALMLMLVVMLVMTQAGVWCRVVPRVVAAVAAA